MSRWPGAKPSVRPRPHQHVGNKFVALTIPDKQTWDKNLPRRIDLKKILLLVTGQRFISSCANTPVGHSIRTMFGFFRIAKANHDVGGILAEVSVLEPVISNFWRLP